MNIRIYQGLTLQIQDDEKSVTVLENTVTDSNAPARIKAIHTISEYADLGYEINR